MVAKFEQVFYGPPPTRWQEMTRISTTKKLVWFLLMVAYFLGGYLVINWLSHNHLSPTDVSTAADHAIPFIPVFIFGYILAYVAPFILFATIKYSEDWYRTMVSFFFATTLAYAFFLIIPVKMEYRPDLSGETGLFVAVTRLIYSVDRPYNCFPSLHLTYPALGTLVTWRNYKVMRWFFVAITVIVGASVLLIKQHYIIDVVAGIANAAFFFWLTVKLEPKWSRLFVKE